MPRKKLCDSNIAFRSSFCLPFCSCSLRYRCLFGRNSWSVKSGDVKVNGIENSMQSRKRNPFLFNYILSVEWNETTSTLLRIKPLLLFSTLQVPNLPIENNKFIPLKIIDLSDWKSLCFKTGRLFANHADFERSSPITAQSISCKI